MRIISKKALKEFWTKHPQAEMPLNEWYRIVNISRYNNLSELKSTFPHADLVGKYTVFNIGGNKYRLITVIHYKSQKVYVRDILTHAEYDKNKWKG